MDLTNLDREMKEAFCELELSGNATAQAQQKELFTQLADEYENGSADTPRDKWRAHYFRKKAGIKSEPPRPEIFSTHFMHSFLWYLNDIRLKAVFSNTALGIVGKSFLPVIFRLVGGILYLGRFFIDMTICLVTVLREYYQEAKANKAGDDSTDMTNTGKENNKSENANISFLDRLINFWNRFRLVLKKGDRPNRILNDVVWGPINLITFFVPPLAVKLILIAASYDFLRISIVVFSNDSKYSRLIRELQSQLNKSTAPEKVNELKYELAQAKKNHFNAKANVVYAGFCNTLILIGLVLTLSPPTLPIGACMMIGGSILLLGPALKEKFKSLVTYFLKDTKLDNAPVQATVPNTVSHECNLALISSINQTRKTSKNESIQKNPREKINSHASSTLKLHSRKYSAYSQQIPLVASPLNTSSCSASFWAKQSNYPSTHPPIQDTLPQAIKVGNAK